MKNVIIIPARYKSSRFPGKPLAYYRHHNNNYSTKNLKEYINELKYWFKKNKVILEKEGYSLSSQFFLLKRLQLKSFLKRFTRL